MIDEQTDDEIFSEQEYDELNLIVNNDIETLKTKGKVSFTKAEVDGIITETLIFTDHDGKNTFTRSSSYRKSDELYNQIQVIMKKMIAAIEREDYEKAAVLKRRKEELLFNQQ